MKAETVSLLCAPGTRERLRLTIGTEPDGTARQALAGVESGVIYPIRDGIPILLDESKVTGHNKQYQGFYNKAAGGYDGVMKLFGALASGGEGKFRTEYLQELEIQPGDRVAEVSIGTGANLHYLPANANYVGLDLSWGMLRRCQKNLKRWQLEAELIMGNAEELPFLDGVFDSVFHVGGINAFNDQAKAILEMIRIAKAGAKLVIVDESAKMMRAIAWMPTAKNWLTAHAEKFSAPVALLPPGMVDVEVKSIAKGNLYCLSFRKPLEEAARQYAPTA